MSRQFFRMSRMITLKFCYTMCNHKRKSQRQNKKEETTHYNCPEEIPDIKKQSTNVFRILQNILSFINMTKPPLIHATSF